MRKRSGAPLLALAVLIALGSTACNGFFVQETVTSMQVSPQDASVSMGTPVQLTATGVNNDGSPATLTNITWTSSAPQVATVSASGLVTGVSTGSATITATAQGISGSSTVTVNNSSSGTITIIPANQTVSSSLGSLQLTATLNGQDVTASSTWSSSNPAVAQFSFGSLASFTGLGTTTITAAFNNAGTTATGSTNLTVGP